MTKACFICTNPHRAEYDKMRIDGMTAKAIMQYAREHYGETNLQYWHFQKHFMNHVEVLVNEAVKANRLRDQVVKEVIKKDIEIVKTFSHNLELVTDNVDKIAKEMDDLEGVMKYGEMFVKLTTESRMIIEQFLRWSTKLNVQDTSEDLFNTIIKCMYDFPPELLDKFAKRWKEINNR